MIEKIRLLVGLLRYQITDHVTINTPQAQPDSRGSASRIQDSIFGSETRGFVEHYRGKSLDPFTGRAFEGFFLVWSMFHGIARCSPTIPQEFSWLLLSSGVSNNHFWCS
ncbi:hypothetical protein G3N59_25550 [Paraburkholderia sp. Ac-20340]|uniref:hypothetical protein n=1 Tax=Paraburkholderia sp. Ac-20340 TaxID=2703888 RepID=UPI00197F538A|nr:hypothetical protein [Paraburkholderia sp. Ac-20340]MBN3856749.1 hypothetical protein [Paraburkholderia sp. Ac-20340]